MGLIASGATDIGRKRKTNQDSFYFNVDNKLFVVADGMGGHNGGDIASQIAAKVLPEYVVKNADLDPIILVTNSIKESNKVIKHFGETHPEHIGMGTTIVSFYFRGQNIYIGKQHRHLAHYMPTQTVLPYIQDGYHEHYHYRLPYLSGN